MDAKGANDFFGPLVPGLVGAVFDEVSGVEVTGHIDVTLEMIAGTGFLFAPAIIALADTLCALGTAHHLSEGQSFTTVELKTNFLGSARLGERVTARATPAHIGSRTQVWDVEVRNENRGRVISLFRCTELVIDVADTRGQNTSSKSSRDR
jgi:1,4-dihydroxy-2-naphthoyl-CoA hydrolase